MRVLILVDDGSTDSSGEICDKYCSVDKRVKVIHQNNKGCSAARNAGIANAKGNLIQVQLAFVFQRGIRLVMQMMIW